MIFIFAAFRLICFLFNRFFDIKILTTSKVNRKAGLGRELIRRSTDLSKVLGFKAIKTEATGILFAFCNLGKDFTISICCEFSCEFSGVFQILFNRQKYYVKRTEPFM